MNRFAQLLCFLTACAASKVSSSPPCGQILLPAGQLCSDQTDLTKCQTTAVQIGGLTLNCDLSAVADSDTKMCLTRNTCTPQQRQIVPFGWTSLYNDPASGKVIQGVDGKVAPEQEPTNWGKYWASKTLPAGDKCIEIQFNPGAFVKMGFIEEGCAGFSDAAVSGPDESLVHQPRSDPSSGQLNYCWVGLSSSDGIPTVEHYKVESEGARVCALAGEEECGEWKEKEGVADGDHSWWPWVKMCRETSSIKFSYKDFETVAQGIDWKPFELPAGWRAAQGVGPRVSLSDANGNHISAIDGLDAAGATLKVHVSFGEGEFHINEARTSVS